MSLTKHRQYSLCFKRLFHTGRSCYCHVEMATSTEIRELKSLIEKLQRDPSILQSPDLGFFRQYIESVTGASIKPVPRRPQHEAAPADAEESEHSDDPDIWKEDDSAQYTEVVAKKDPTESQLDEAGEKKNAAMEATNFAEKIRLMTEALSVKPGSSMWWAARAQMYLDGRKAHCAIRDANKAIELNPDSAKALRARGIAYRHVGKWEEAARDLAAANQIDYDEKTAAIAKLVTERATNLRNARLRKEAELEARSHQQSASQPSPSRRSGDAHSDPAAAADFAASLPPQFAELAKDPELAEMLAKPGVMNKLKQAMSSGNMMEIMMDPEFSPILNKFMGKFGPGDLPGGMPGMPGGFPGGFPQAAPAPQRSAPRSAGPVPDADVD
jgi:suppressor of tumorigenicity protein 13